MCLTKLLEGIGLVPKMPDVKLNPTLPARSDPAVDTAGRAARSRAADAPGFASTILTRRQDREKAAPIARKALTGV